MKKEDLAVATMTWARTPGEEALLKEGLTALNSFGISIYVADGGSGSSFISFLKTLPNVVLADTQERGLWKQVQCSLRAARQSGKPFLLYTEPDKANFFNSELEKFIAAAPGSPGTGVILASRTAPAFATFPVFQQTTETTINFACAEVTGNAFDYTYGPFIFNSELMAHLANLPYKIDWGWRPYVFCLAHRLGYQLTQHEGDFACPEDQRSDTPAERIYRLKQLHQNIEGVVLAASASIG